MKYCKSCDWEMERESIAYDAEWICVNPNCERSPNFVPFLRCPNNINFRLVNDDNDVSIRLRRGTHSYDDLIILRMAEDKNHYGWFIESVDMEEESQLPIDGARYFQDLNTTVENAIQFIEQGRNIYWQSKVNLIRAFLEVNRG